MLSVIGGLTIMSGATPLAAQSPSATRSFDETTVLPGGALTVTIELASGTSALATVIETLPAGFTYGSSSLDAAQVTQNGQIITFVPLGAASFTYSVTASDVEDTHSFSGILQISPGNTEDVGGTSDVVVATTPPPPPTGSLQFDVVPSKAVKGALVSGLGYPIASNPLEWDVSDDIADGASVSSIAGNGMVGDFQIKEAGSGKFRLYVMNSNAPALSGSEVIDVTVTYDDDSSVRLRGTITERDVLNAPDSFTFTVPQNVESSTPIASFDVMGKIPGESLDGIINGGDAAPFGVNDADMTIYRKNGANLEVRDYEFTLTVNGDAGLAARADRADVTIRVTASNDKHDAPDTFAATIYENIKGAGLVSANTAVGDASAGITNPDGDKLAYSLEDDTPFVIDSETGQITVGADGIGDDDTGMNVEYEFDITVSDGVTANDAVISATVTVDVNDPVTPKSDGLPDGVTKAADSAIYTVTTPKVAGSVNGYHILDVSDLVVLDLDADGETETPEYTPSVRTAPLNVDNVGRLLLTHVPRGLQDGTNAEGEALDSINVEIDDGYNPSITITINVVLNVKERPDQITPSLAASIDENMTGEVQDALKDLDSTGNATLASLIDLINEVEDDEDSVNYKHTGGTNGGEPGAGAIFSVDPETGAISLNMAQDADALDVMPSVVLQVERESDGADLGVIFVSITINT